MKKFPFFVLIPLTVLLIVVILCLSTPNGEQQFSHLADAFLHGQLNFLDIPKNSSGDLVYSNNKIYWALGPLPAIILMPFVAVSNIFDAFFSQRYLQWILVLGVFGMVYALAKRLRYSPNDSIVLAFGFVLGSMFIGVASSSKSWYFAQVVATALMFWALLEYFGAKRWLRIGIICALLLLTRVSAAFIIIFFGLEILRNKQKKPKIRAQLTQLFGPFIVALFLLGAYNFARFGDIFEQGYAFQELPYFYENVRSMGLLSLSHIPTNFFYAFLNGPLPIHAPDSFTLVFPYFGNNPWGMSIFLTSPYLLFLFTLKRENFSGQIKALFFTALIIAVFVLSWYATGWRQFGYRLALDFMPLLFVIFMLAYRQRFKYLSGRMKILLLGSGVLNLYLLMTFLSPYQMGGV